MIDFLRLVVLLGAVLGFLSVFLEARRRRQQEEEASRWRRGFARDFFRIVFVVQSLYSAQRIPFTLYHEGPLPGAEPAIEKPLDTGPQGK